MTGQPWGLSSSQFLGLYAAGIGLTVAIPVVFRQVIRYMPGRGPSRELDPYELGCLAGGPGRAAEVVVADIVTSGALRVSSSGRLSEVGPAAIARCPRAAALSPIPYGMRTTDVCKKLTSVPGIAGIRPHLRAEGLLVSAGRVIAWRLVTAGLVAALLWTGFARNREGVAGHGPPGYLGDLVVPAIFICIGMLIFVLSASSMTTTRGARYLRQRRRAFAPAAGYAGEAVLIGVALSGFSAVPDEATRDALLAGMSTGSSGGSSCAGCGD
jgi:uncharacterized protein (TIGR04222 family)